MNRFVLLIALAASTVSALPIKLAHEPALSPDGKTVAFGWQGDIWSAPVAGGKAMRLTTNAALESGAAFSPDGRQLAFNSDREGSKQLYVMPATGGDPKQLTWHTDGCDLREWLPDGKGMLVSIVRDYSWMRESRAGRMAIVDATERKAESLLFDDYASDGTMSPDGRRMLFVREGTESWWRQGYQGSRAGQIWLFNRDDGSFTQLISEKTEARWPLWKADGKGFYFVTNRDGTFNLWNYDLASKKSAQLTHFKGDSVVFPAISRDGKTLVFRVKFDLYRWHPGDKEPALIALEAATDATPPDIERVLLDKATAVSFTSDGLQMAFCSGGDVWVMDTELKEPKQVTRTAQEERGVQFSPDGKTLLFVSDAEGRTDLWKAERADVEKYWWENAAFTLSRLTNDDAVESNVRFTSNGKHIGYLKGTDLWMADADGHNARRLVETWDAPSFDFSPDGMWVVYSLSDEWFNEDVWVMPVDGSKPAFNLSRHPNNDTRPAWSPDGKMIAWTGKREFDEVDVFYVNLRAEDDEKTKRERTLAKAKEKIKKAASGASTTRSSTTSKSGTKTGTTTTPKPEPKPSEPVKIDFDDIHERVHRISIPNSEETSLAWSPDSKRLSFHASIDGKKGTYAVDIPDDLKPKLISDNTILQPHWIKQDDQIVGLHEGKPAIASTKGGPAKTVSFRAPQSCSRTDRQRAVFDQCWQVMRDHYYDERHGNRDWNAVRTKYADMAAQSPDMKGVVECVWLMLGELNGSHLGFMLEGKSTFERTWHDETAHLGLRFDPTYAGPGWKVNDVIAKGPASRKESRIEAGEIVLKIDGKDVSLGVDASLLLNGHPERDIVLQVKSAAGAERDVTLRPISYSTARKLLYDEWIKDNRRVVETKSNGKLGYLHISAMDDASFQKFQEELYAAGAGKDGLVIDVRENGGGSTTDHLLTTLTQPQHAITVPRGGQPGYPQDRIVYATWNKPIVVMCNQNSYSNAEIFSHAIKTTKRGKVVGTPTAGGVISTGATDIMDIGKLRLPFRGWYGLNDGKDMELNGAVPDFIIWPQPGDHAKGIDAQLDKAIEVLAADVKTWQQKPKPKLIKATER